MLSFRKKILFSSATFLSVCLGLFFLSLQNVLGNNLETRCFMTGSLLLILYAHAMWGICLYLTRPIQEIIRMILPMQKGREEFLPHICLTHLALSDEFYKLASTLNDQTERIQTQIGHLVQQKKQTELLLDSLGEGIIAFDPSSLVTFANPVVCALFHLSEESLIGKRLDQIESQAKELLLKCHELVQETLQTLERSTQTEIIEENGRTFWNLIAAPLAYQSGVILVFQDKTPDLKVLEMGKDFIANASHELKTPITIIRGFAETLQDIPNLSDAMQKEIVAKIVKTCGRLERLVKSLLTMNDIENISQNRFFLCDLIGVAHHCKHLFLTAHPEAQITVSVDVLAAPIFGDPDLLDLAIMNLLENAHRYSSPPSKIEICVKEVDSHFAFSVKDSGIGIPKEELPYIFDRFYTVDKARSRKLGGAGLGLSIVKTILEKHQGQVSVTSDLGKGSCFTLLFGVYRC